MPQHALGSDLMKVHNLELIYDYGKRHAEVRAQLAAWLTEAQDAQWETPSDIKTRYPAASFISDSRVVFNLKGNKYRLDVKVNYKNKQVLIKRIGTHAEYDKWTF
jgi:mRNA interferase HigB